MSVPRHDHCTQCGSALEKPGDYCLVCREPNADGVVVDTTADRARITMLQEDGEVGETIVTTTPETGERERTERRNYVGRIVDEIRRKRPEDVYLSGDRDVIRAVQAELSVPCYRIGGDAPVRAAIDRRTDRDLAIINRPPADKIGGSHTSVIGDRAGERYLHAVAEHPHVKKIIPGPIETGGSAGGGVSAKITRADDTGNLRLLLGDGSSVQTVRVVTTAMDRARGERLAEDLSTVLADLETE